jgi:hypothetical protein
MKITPALRVTPTTAEIQAQLKAGRLKVAGPTTIDGRKASNSPRSTARTDTNTRRARHLLPDQTGRPEPGHHTITTTYNEYRLLPATPANQRLLSVAARHPGARIDHNPADYQAAQARLITGS